MLPRLTQYMLIIKNGLKADTNFKEKFCARFYAILKEILPIPGVNGQIKYVSASNEMRSKRIQ